jgi:hypothetical protein
MLINIMNSSAEKNIIDAIEIRQLPTSLSPSEILLSAIGSAAAAVIL